MWYDAGRGHTPLLRLWVGDVRPLDRHRRSWVCSWRWRAPTLHSPLIPLYVPSLYAPLVAHLLV